MRKIFLLANLCLASGLAAPRILFAESGLIFDQDKGMLTGQLNVTSNVSAAGSVTASSATLTNTSGAGLAVSSSAYLAISGGNVGIGTAGPNYKLDVTGPQVGSETAPSPLAVLYKRYNDAAVDNRGAGPSLVFSHGLTSSASGKSAAMSSPSEDPAGYSRSVGLGFWTSATDADRAEVMRISGSGNVGIGATTPNAKLHVTDSVSNLRFGHNLSAGSGGPSLMLETASNVYGDILWNTVSADQVRLRGSSYGLALGGTNPRLNIGYPDANYTSAALVVNGNVGIGTTAPTAKLAVGVSAYSPNLSGKMAEFSSGGGWGYIAITNGNTANSAIAIGGASGITSFNRVTDAGVLSESMRIDSTGNVGIGTTSPAHSFIVNTANITTAETISSFLAPNLTNGNRVALIVGKAESVNNAAYIGYTPNATGNQSLLNLGFFGADNLVNIRADGNVGIGTAGPGQALEVNGRGLFTGATNAAAGALQVTSGDPSLRLKWTTSPTADQNTYEIRNIGTSPNTYLQFRTINDANTVFTTRMALWNSGGLYLGVTPTDVGAGNLKTEGAIAIAGTGNSTIAGNVGIGTTGPNAKLVVTGTSGSPGDAGIFHVTTGDGTNLTDKLVFGVNDSGYSWVQAVKPGSDVKSLALNPNGGNVGIGTTNPSTRLTISKPIDSSAYGAGTQMIDFKSYFPGYDLDTVKSSIYGGVSSQGSLNTRGGYLAFMTSNDGTLGERVRIEKNGNVGIGTTGPGYKLDVNGTLGVTSAATFSNTVGLFGGSAQLYIGSAGTAGNFSTFIWNDTNKALEITGTYAGGSPDMTIKSGNVGIGTTAPNSALAVNGLIQLAGNGPFISCDSAHRGALRLDQGGAGVKDSVYVCAKDAANVYGWRVLY